MTRKLCKTVVQAYKKLTVTITHVRVCVWVPQVWAHTLVIRVEEGMYSRCSVVARAGDEKSRIVGMSEVWYAGRMCSLQAWVYNWISDRFV